MAALTCVCTPVLAHLTPASSEHIHGHFHSPPAPCSLPNPSTGVTVHAGVAPAHPVLGYQHRRVCGVRWLAGPQGSWVSRSSRGGVRVPPCTDPCPFLAFLPQWSLPRWPRRASCPWGFCCSWPAASFLLPSAFTTITKLAENPRKSS